MNNPFNIPKLQQYRLPLPDRTRALMLQQVRRIWVEGMLNHPLYSEIQLKLDLLSDPHKVDLPVRMLVQEAGGQSKILPKGIRIVDIFDHFDGMLLILGQPGSGKTTLLLDLARELLNRAENDNSLPIPVVFPLSGWKSDQNTLDRWLIEQLHQIYQVSREQASSWIEQSCILPLLDGLDEVSEAKRLLCARAINIFRENYSLIPLVVCSRLWEYEVIIQETNRLQLNGAVIVQELSNHAVMKVLTKPELQATDLYEKLSKDPFHWLWSMINTPLGLSVIIPAVRHNPTIIEIEGNENEKRNIVFETYVDAMFARRTAKSSWSREKTIFFLGWTAVQMKIRDQTLLLLDNLQPDHLSQRWKQVLVRKSASIIVTIVLALFFAIMSMIIIGIQSELNLIWISFALMFFLGTLMSFSAIERIIGGRIGDSIELTEKLDWSWEIGWWSVKIYAKDILIYGLMYSVIGWILSVILFQLFGLLVFSSSTLKTLEYQRSNIFSANSLAMEIVVGLFFGVLLGLPFAFITGINAQLKKIASILNKGYPLIGLYPQSFSLHLNDYLQVPIYVRRINPSIPNYFYIVAMHGFIGGIIVGLIIYLHTGIVNGVFGGLIAFLVLVVVSIRRLNFIKEFFAQILDGWKLKLVIITPIVLFSVYIDYIYEGFYYGVLGTIVTFLHVFVLFMSLISLPDVLEKGIDDILRENIADESDGEKKIAVPGNYVLAGGFIGAIGSGLLIFAKHSMTAGFISSLIGGILVNFLVLLFIGFFSGLSVVPLENKLRPNQSIINSAYNGLICGLICGLMCGLVSGLVCATVSTSGRDLFIGLALALSCGLLIGLPAGLVFWLRYGGGAVVQHYTLRLLLAFSGLAPLNYDAFLDYAADRVLLRRVGGGWIFVHRLLLDYFAQRWINEQGTEKQSR